MNNFLLLLNTSNSPLLRFCVSCLSHVVPVPVGIPGSNIANVTQGECSCQMVKELFAEIVCFFEFGTEVLCVTVFIHYKHTHTEKYKFCFFIILV